MITNRSFLVCLIPFIICCNNNITNLPTDQFTKEHLLHGEPFKQYKEPGNPFTLLLISDTVLLTMDPTCDNIINLINVKNGEILRSFGKIGKGPGEFLSPTCFIEKNKHKRSFEVYDVNQRRTISFDIDSLIEKEGYRGRIIKDFSETDFWPFNIIKINEDYVGIGTFKKGIYGLIDEENNTCFFLDYPKDDKHKNTINEHKAMAYQGKLKVRPNHQDFVFATLSGGIMEICELNGKRILKKKNIHSYLPTYKVVTKGEGYGAVTSNENPHGYSDICATEDYIYVLFSGKTYKEHSWEMFQCEHLLVYDWKGNPVKNYKLDFPINSITVNTNNNTIWGLSNTPEPEIVSFKFNLNE